MAAFSASSHLKSVKGNARMTSMRPKRNMKKKTVENGILFQHG